MLFLVLGSTYFDQALTRLGHRIVRPEYGQSDPDLADILARMDTTPDALLLVDDLGRRVFPKGLRTLEAPRVYYAVDGPINAYWQRHFSALFDVVMVDQKNSAQNLNAMIPAQAVWLPVAVDTSMYQGPPETKTHDIAFVGVLSEQVRPKRSRIVEMLSHRYNVITAGGRRQAWVSAREAAVLYRRSRLVLNENLFDGVTTRMFETMAAGSMLLTEDGNNGLADLFDIGTDLDVFTAGDLFDKVDHYLARDDERERITRQGHEMVLARHDIMNRTASLLEHIARARPDIGLNGAAHDREKGKTLFLTGLRWPAHQGWERVLRAERLLMKAVHHNEGDPESLFFLGIVARIKGSRAAALNRLNQAADAGCIRAGLALGYLDLETGNTSAARKRLSQASRSMGIEFPHRFEPGGKLSPDQHVALARVLQARGHDINPGFSRFGLDIAMYNAIEHYQAVLEINPNHRQALISIGRILAQQRAHTEAYPFLARAAELGPKDKTLAAEALQQAQQGYIRLDHERKVA
jgi:tetratricopeptide (TPR) repeat protein